MARITDTYNQQIMHPSSEKYNQYYQNPNSIQESVNNDGSFNFFQDNSCLPSYKDPLNLGESENSDFLHCQPLDKIQTLLPTKATEDEVFQSSKPKPKPFTSRISPFMREQTKLRYKRAYQGRKDDTVELNTNFKTILVNFQKELILANELNEHEIKHINQFTSRGASFPSLKMLFERTTENEGIRRLCLQFFSSSECIKKIMVSRCKHKTKIQMIKYIQKMRLNILRPDIIKWKDVVEPLNRE